MPKLIPLSSKKMKEMGIVQTKNGFMVNIQIPRGPKSIKPIKEHYNNKIAKAEQTDKNNKDVIASKKKNERIEAKEKTKVKDSNNKTIHIKRAIIRQVASGNTPVKQEMARLEARGVYS